MVGSRVRKRVVCKPEQDARRVGTKQARKTGGSRKLCWKSSKQIRDYNGRQGLHGWYPQALARAGQAEGRVLRLRLGIGWARLRIEPHLKHAERLEELPDPPGFSDDSSHLIGIAGCSTPTLCISGRPRRPLRRLSGRRSTRDSRKVNHGRFIRGRGGGNLSCRGLCFSKSIEGPMDSACGSSDLPLPPQPCRGPAAVLGPRVPLVVVPSEVFGVD